MSRVVNVGTIRADQLPDGALFVLDSGVVVELTDRRSAPGLGVALSITTHWADGADGPTATMTVPRDDLYHVIKVTEV